MERSRLNRLALVAKFGFPSAMQMASTRITSATPTSGLRPVRRSQESAAGVAAAADGALTSVVLLMLLLLRTTRP
jgi:hypothetical protein